MELTDSQKAAVEARGRNLMISAAAGSGKTATLTKRIISLLTDKNDPADISGMLIVTFTRAAAAELKSRITDALSRALAEDPGNLRLSRQLTLVGAAKISTIDSYYHSLCRENFQRAGLPSSFRIADEGESELMKKDTASDVAEYLFKNEPTFSHFAETLTDPRNEIKLAEMLIGIEQSLSSSPNGIETLKINAELYRKEASEDFFESRAGRVLKKRAKAILENLIRRSSAIRNMIDEHDEAAPYRSANDSDSEFFTDALTLLDNATYGEFMTRLASYSPQKTGSVSKKDANAFTKSVLDMRNKNKATIRSLSAKLFNCPPAVIKEYMLKTAVFCDEAYIALEAYTKALDEKKKARMILGFSDLKRGALKLLLDADGQPTEIALAERKRYSHIFVDEYQDTDEIQDLIFRTISNGKNLFIVGDIKQSIYSFRGAEPGVFSAYRRTYPVFGEGSPEGEPGAIYMSENFRCAKDVIDFTNLVCGYLFEETEEHGAGIGFRKEDNLIFSRKYPDGAFADAGMGPDGTAKTTVILTENRSDTEDSLDAEIKTITDEIVKIKSTCRRADGNSYSYGDFAVLAKDNNTLERIAAHLSAAGIPYSDYAGEDLFENAEVTLFFSLLSAVDNPLRDIHLASALVSPIFGFSLDELVCVRNENRSSSLYSAICAYPDADGASSELASMCRQAREKLESLRKRASLFTLSRFIRSLWKETDAIGYAGADPADRNKTPAERRRNLERLYSLALNYEAGEYRTLHDFVRYVNSLLERKSKIRTESEPSGDSVRIMTVHKSKGLEFPVVFLAAASKNKNEPESKSTFVYSRIDGLGAAVKLTDINGLSSVDTPLRRTIVSRDNEFLREEDLRVLYVALTRARDLLYITASGKQNFIEKLKENGRDAHAIGGREQILGERSFITWISAATAGFTLGDSYTVRENIIENEALDDSLADGELSSAEAAPVAGSASEEAEVSESGDENAADAEYREKLKEILSRRFSYSYPYSAVSSLPSKLSVSRLFPDALTLSADEDAPANTNDPLIALLSAEKIDKSLPDFMTDGIADKAADRGTATHLFLQFCEFSALGGSADDVEKEAERLAAEAFIPKEAVQLIRKDEIAAFSSSAFFKMLKTAPFIRRETRFNIFLPASDFTTDPERKKALEGEKIAVQGVIDLFFRTADGKLVLCDYKTDRLTKAERASDESVAAVMKMRHGEQLSYYAMALERICSQRPDRITVFPLAYGKAVEIEV